MELKLTIESADSEFAAKQASSMKKWILDENSEITVKQEKKKLKPDDASPDILLNSLYIALNAPAVIILAKSLHTWIKERTKQKKNETKKISITFETENGIKFSLDSHNAGYTEEQIVRYLSDKLLNK